VDRAGMIKQFIVDQYLADATVGQLRDDYDLISNGVISSLGLLRLIAWLEDRFQISATDIDLTPDDFRTVIAIDDFVARAPERSTARTSKEQSATGHSAGE